MIEPLKIWNEIKTKAQLAFPDLNEDFHMKTDACDTGIGAVLYQSKGIVGYFSKKLNTT